MKLRYLLLLFPAFLLAQTQPERQKIIRQTNTAYLNAFSAKSSRNFVNNKKKAFALAAIYNWPKFITADSSYAELMGVTGFNKPIYYTTYNRGAGITSRANKLYSGGGLGLAIEGQNMLAAIWDAGAALPEHELYTGRVQVMDGTLQSHSHATHVMGTVLGTDLVQNGNARGMAFKANGHSYDWGNDLSEAAEAAANGLLLSNHSYGYSPEFVSTDTWGKYDNTSADVDELLYNAPYYQMVVAAGNSNGGGFNTDKNGYDLLAGMGVSKNAIIVAAVDEVANYTGPASVHMSWFSSWGPTDDGRVKPDISAKGVNTYSSVDASTSSYSSASGTSVAAPSATGTLLLLQQYYNLKNNNFMKAATVRGLMIHSADEAGDAPGPDYKFGWGLINAEKAANVISKDNFQSVILENTLTQGNPYVMNVTALGNGPLVATLCWTDPAGNPITNNEVDDATAALVNDLDVRITKGGTNYMPWKLDAGNPGNAATQGDNIVDNVEKIQVANPTGDYTVTVSHKGTLNNQPQHYSLIISGIRVRNFSLTTAQDTKAICNSTELATYDFDFAVQPDFTQPVTFSVPGVPAGVTAAFSNQNLSASGATTLTLGNLSVLAPGTYTFNIHAAAGSNFEEVPVTLTIYAPITTPVVLTAPANGASLQQPVNFTWNAISNAINYEIQVATDAAFSNIVIGETVTANSYATQSLENNTPYYWRVRATNTCGQGPYSATGSFATTCATPTDIVLAGVTGTSATIAWNQNTGGQSWEIEIVPQGATPTGNTLTITDNPYTEDGLMVDTCYDFYIRSVCPNGFNTVWVGPFTFCTQPDFCAGAHFLDTGGSDGEYSDNENSTTVIYPDNANSRVRAIFNSFSIEEDYDYMYVYDGPDTSSPLIYTATGTDMQEVIVSSHPTGALTFVFVSDQFVTDEGWDATIICEPLPPCSLELANLAVSSVTPTGATLSWTDGNAALSWNVQVVPQGQTPQGAGTAATTNPYTVIGLSEGTCYDFYVQSVCADGLSAWVGPLSFCTPPDYCGGTHFYDTGGAGGEYSVNENYTTTITPGGAGQRVRANFTAFDIEAGYDYLYVYDGPDTSSPLLLTATGTDSPGSVASTHPTGALTFRFTSDDVINAPGWDAAIICEPMPPCGLSVNNVAFTNITSSQATIAWNEINTGVLSWQVQVVPQGTLPAVNGTPITTSPYTATGLNSGLCYDVYLKTICSEGVSAWSGPFGFCTLPDYCAGDHFYDTGGANGNYDEDENITTVIYPHDAGDSVKAIFTSFETEDGFDFLSIYNGPDASGELLFHGSGNTSPGTVQSTHPSGALTFVFVSDDIETRAGWDAMILCEPLSPCATAPQNVRQVAATGTSATIAWDEANPSSQWEIYVVSQGATPAGEATAINTNPYTATGLTINTCYDFYVRSVCSDITSGWAGPYTFCTSSVSCGGHFYDTGGATGSYSDMENSTTVIYPGAPGQAVSAVFNSFQLEDCCDYLRIYNGPDTSYPLLFMGNGNASPGTVTATNSVGALTFWFTSNDGATFSGWDATIACTQLSVDEPLKQNSVTCYPNPVTNELTVHATNLVEHFEVYDITSKLILSQRAGQKDFLIDFSAYSAGAYFITLHTTEGETLHLKVLKD
ncbi:fibronectin type III domain-containing protein [Flavobacterium sp. RHBU_24]|uniref:fibronectin type III domain-containing protein n=1 Tax=Flavobacterium sp. RHBU_24 TaxID=3391185 RepID=UPI0039848F9A